MHKGVVPVRGARGQSWGWKDGGADRGEGEEGEEDVPRCTTGATGALSPPARLGTSRRTRSEHNLSHQKTPKSRGTTVRKLGRPWRGGACRTSEERTAPQPTPHRPRPGGPRRRACAGPRSHGGPQSSARRPRATHPRWLAPRRWVPRSRWCTPGDSRCAQPSTRSSGGSWT